MPRTKRKPTKRKAKPRVTKIEDDLDLAPFTEHQLTRDLSEDLADAWLKLRGFAADQGEQRIYASATAIMFARRVVYLFVRPKKSYLQVNIILPKLIESKLIKRGNRVSESRAVNTFRLEHADQIEEPLIDWIRAAFEFTK